MAEERHAPLTTRNLRELILRERVSLKDSLGVDSLRRAVRLGQLDLDDTPKHARRTREPLLEDGQCPPRLLCALLVRGRREPLHDEDPMRRALEHVASDDREAQSSAGAEQHVHCT